MNDRKAWVDISKGIAILLVIFEHSLLDSDWLLARVILIFHMPFFFFISGYCFNIKGTSHEVVVAYIRRTILNTLRIVGIIGLVSFPFYTMKSFLKGELTIELIATNFCNYIYGNSIQGHAFGGGYWFIVTLMWCKIIFAILKKYDMKIRATIIIALMILGPLTNFHKYALLPLSMDNITFALIFYMAGEYIKEAEAKECCIQGMKYRKISIVILGLVVILCAYYNCGPVLMYKNIYGIYPLFYLGAFAGIFGICQVSHCIDSSNNCKGLRQLFTYFGNTL